MALRYHLSPLMGEWMECRADQGNCPFGEHPDLPTLLTVAHKFPRSDEPLPPVRTTSGTLRHFQFHDDGTFSLGSRRYAPDGTPMLSPSSLRARKSRAKARGVESPPVAVAPAAVPEVAVALAPGSEVAGDPVFRSRKEKLAFIHREAREAMDAQGLEHVPFAFDNATRAIGRTHYKKNRYSGEDFKVYKVTLSRYWSDRLSLDEMRDTIAHEVAHAVLPHGHHHDDVWKAKCLELGGNGDATHDTNHLSAEVRFEWIGECVQGHRSHHERKPSGPSSCSDCCDVFSPDHMLHWKRNGEPVPFSKMGPRWTKYADAA